MDRSSNAGGGEIYPTGVGLRVGNKFGYGFGGKLRIHNQYIRRAEERRDRRNVADEVERELLVKRRTDHISRSDQQECVSVRSGTHDHFSPNVGACSWPILDYK